jgi:hypothetical protein
MEKAATGATAIFPIRQQIVSISASQVDPDRPNHLKAGGNEANDEIQNTVVIRSTYTTANGTSERQLICDGDDHTFSKVAEAMVSDHEKVAIHGISLNHNRQQFSID